MTQDNVLHAGYMTKQLNNVYEGELTNGTGGPIFNGVIVERTRDGLTYFASSACKFLCKELTTIYGGIPAARFVVTALDRLCYFVDNQIDINDSAEYDGTAYTTPDLALLRVHPLQVGEEFVITTLVKDVSVGSEYGVAGGVVGVSADE